MVLLWDSSLLPVPANVPNYVEWITGHRVEDGTEVRPLSPAERLESQQILARDNQWLALVKARTETLEIRYHDAELQRAFEDKTSDSFVTDFHVRWLAKLDANAATAWKEKLESPQRESLSLKRIRWKSSTNEFIRESSAKWVETMSDGNKAYLRGAPSAGRLYRIIRCKSQYGR